MTGTAQFSLIDLIHSHFTRGLLHAEILWMTVIAGECGGVELMAENHIAQAFNLIREFFVKFPHSMTFRAFGRGESLFAVMALPAVCSCIYVFHGYGCGAGLHNKNLRMAIPAPRLPGMCFMIEF
jgi:hypothetical protein